MVAKLSHEHSSIIFLRLCRTPRIKIKRSLRHISFCNIRAAACKAATYSHFDMIHEKKKGDLITRSYKQRDLRPHRERRNPKATLRNRTQISLRLVVACWRRQHHCQKQSCRNSCNNNDNLLEVACVSVRSLLSLGELDHVIYLSTAVCCAHAYDTMGV